MTVGTAQQAKADVIQPPPITVGANPVAVAVSPLGNFAYVANYGADTLSIVDLAASPPSEIYAVATGDGPTAVAVSLDGARVYVANREPMAVTGSLTVVDITTTPPSVTAPIPLAGKPSRAVMSSTGQLFITADDVGAVLIFNTLVNPPVSVDMVLVGSQPDGIALNSSGTRAYVANRSGNSISVIDTTMTPATVLDTLALPPASAPSDVAVSADGNTAFVTLYGPDRIMEVDVSVSPPAIGNTAQVGGNPTEIAVAPGSRAYVVNFTDSSVSAVDVRTETPGVGQTVVVGGVLEAIAITADGTRALLIDSAVNRIVVLALDTPPSLAAASLPSGTVATAYNATLAFDGTPTPTLAVTSGALPTGLVLDPTTGEVDGTPTIAGTFVFTVAASSTVSGIPMTAEQTYQITIATSGGSGGGGGGGSGGSGSSGSGGGTLANTGVAIDASLAFVGILFAGALILASIRLTVRREKR